VTRYLLLLFVLAWGLTACGGDGATSSETATSEVYLSLGDSVAAGNGASDPASTSFAAIVAEQEQLDLVNLAFAGATTNNVIEKQLPQITNAIGERPVTLITLSAGGNDLAGLIPNATCQEDPLPPPCPLEETLSAVADRYRTILTFVRNAYPAADIVVLAYPNFFSGTGHVFEAPASRVLPRLGATLREVVLQYERVGVAAPSFEGQGGELTHVLDARFDPHPNDAGHRVIAEAIVAAVGELRED
jgi:lysophospholipase L1-like esterase